MIQNPETTDVLVKLFGKNRFICFYVKGFFVCSDILVVGVGILTILCLFLLFALQ